MRLRHVAAACFACVLFADVGPPSGDSGCGCDDDDATTSVVSCTSELECGAGRVCCLGTCKASCPGRTCTDAADCPAGDRCAEGACVPVPRDDSDPGG